MESAGEDIDAGFDRGSEFGAEAGEVDFVEGVGGDEEAGDDFASDADEETLELEADVAEGIRCLVEGGGVFRHDGGLAADDAGGVAECAGVGEEGEEFRAGFAEDRHAGGGFLGGVVDFADGGADFVEGFVGGDFGEVFCGEAELVEGVGRGASAAFGDGDQDLLHLADGAGEVLDAGVFSCLVEDHQGVDGDAGFGGHVRETAAEVEDVFDAVADSAGGDEAGGGEASEALAGDGKRAAGEVPGPFAEFLLHAAERLADILDGGLELGVVAGENCGGFGAGHVRI